MGSTNLYITPGGGGGSIDIGTSIPTGHINDVLFVGGSRGTPVLSQDDNFTYDGTDLSVAGTVFVHGGRDLYNGNADSIGGTSIIGTSPGTTQLLRFNGTSGKWEPGYLNTGDLLVGGGQGVVGCAVTGNLILRQGTTGQIFQIDGAGDAKFADVFPLVVNNTNLLAQTTGLAVLDYAPADDVATYAIDFYFNVTAGNIVQAALTFTDENSVGRSIILRGIKDSAVVNTTTWGTGYIQGFRTIVRAKSSAHITVTTSVASGTYDSGFILSKLSNT